MITVKQHISATYDGKYAGDARHPLKKDQLGFLLELTPVASSPNFTPRRRLEIRPHPVRTTGSLVEILFGTIYGDRTDVEALGVAVVTEVAVNGRGKIQTLWGDDARKALSVLAYPELADELAEENLEYLPPETAP